MCCQRWHPGGGVLPRPEKAQPIPWSRGLVGGWCGATSKADAFPGPSCLLEGVFTASVSAPQLCESTMLYALGTSLADFIFPIFLGQKPFYVFFGEKNFCYFPTCEGLEALVLAPI